MELTVEEIAEILRVFAESELEELNLELGDVKLFVSKKAGVPTLPRVGGGSAVAGPAPKSPASTPAEAAGPQLAKGDSRAGQESSPADSPTDGTVELRSPLFGVFYRRPSPDQPPLVEVGSKVDSADDVCIIDVMKLFTRVRAGTAGTIVEICTEDAEVVEYGQLLMRIRPR